MSRKFQAIWDEIRALPPAELEVGCGEIRRQGWEEQKAKLRGLLSRLLDEDFMLVLDENLPGEQVRLLRMFANSCPIRLSGLAQNE